jgi:Coenzyme PQQ synthesis protein D (PqqD)
MRASGPSSSTARWPRGSRIVRCADVVACTRPDGTVLVDVGAGRRITLDRFGSYVWMQLADQPTLPTLVARLRDAGTSTERVAEDVTRLLAWWRGVGVIAWR